MLTFLAALAVCAAAAAPILAGEWRRRPSLPAAADAAGGNPWPEVPAVAAGRRLYDRERVAE